MTIACPMRLEPWGHLGEADTQKRQEQPRQNCAVVQSLSRVFKIESEERCVVLHMVDQASLQSFDRLPVLVWGRLDEILASTFVTKSGFVGLFLTVFVEKWSAGSHAATCFAVLAWGALFVAGTPTSRPGTSPTTAPFECSSSARCKESVRLPSVPAPCCSTFQRTCVLQTSLLHLLVTNFDDCRSKSFGVRVQPNRSGVHRRSFLTREAVANALLTGP